MTDLLQRERVSDEPQFTRDRTRRLRVGVPMLSAFVLIVGLVLLMTRPASSPYDVLPEIAEYASQAGLTGLSPASMHPIEASPYSALPEIAKWADEHGYTGLSPASLIPTDNMIRYLVNPANAEMISEIARYADQAGLTGLSPASLGPIETNPYSVSSDVAEWANQNGYSGLSPASLTRIDR
jgi:hypothetical protein